MGRSIKNDRFFALITGLTLLWWGIAAIDSIPESQHQGNDKPQFFEKEERHTPKNEAPEMHALLQRQLRTPADREFPEYVENQVLEAYQRARAVVQSARITNELNFIERGPGNIGGRTRAIAVDLADATNNTWFAGASSGGIWKTTDAGATWENISGDLPNLSVNVLEIAPSNPEIIYAGTGEHFTADFDGSGLFKSNDHGMTWQQIVDPSDFPDMRNITRLIIDPNDEHTVVLTSLTSVWSDDSRGAIYKTTDGGATWTRTRSAGERYDDIDHDPTDFNRQYVSVHGKGVIRSADGGETWQNAGRGLAPNGRIEVAVSTVDPNRLWASAQGSESGTGSDLYVSLDGADNWNLMTEKDSAENADFLGGQGWYDNIVLPHPFDQNIVYVGGVNLWKFTLEEGGETFTSLDVKEDNTTSFMDFVNFGGPYFGGGLDLGEFDSLVNVEIRFGQGTQMGHRFTVNFQGSGVDPGGYEYEDYVEVPFQVWDVTNNIQLAVSFRDQQEDGKWDLILQQTDGSSVHHSREYLYVHQVPYAETANDSIARDGGQEYNFIYNLWPVLAPGATFDPAALPVSSLNISLFEGQVRFRTTDNISDAYNEFSKINTFTNRQFIDQEGIHPDHHGLIAIPSDSTLQTFSILVSNDGGIYQSKVSESPGSSDEDFQYKGFGYNTTQFYGADKAPGEDRYVGGMQDNSSWFTAAGDTGSATTRYKFAVGGDGFEALWNNRDPNQMLVSIQHNRFARTEDGGQNWLFATSGLDDEGPENAPFISRLANSKQRPDRVYAVGRTGVWTSVGFGRSWEPTPINSPFWIFRSSLDVEVSDADTDIVWAGGGLSEGERLFVSTDGGRSFNPVEQYTGAILGVASGFKPHPNDPNTAYALFSFAGRPKVLKTSDLGQTWIDISGYEGNGGSSDRGFPDVAVHTILVFPTNEDRIWVGSEIGIIESLDGGASWHLLDSNLPPVTIYDFKIQDDEIVIATYGRGIWTVSFPELEREIFFPPILEEVSVAPDGRTNFEIAFDSQFDSAQLLISNAIIATLYENEVGQVQAAIENLGIDGFHDVQVVGYLDGDRFESDKFTRLIFEPSAPAEGFQTDFNNNRMEDFIGTGFEVNHLSGFPDPALQTEHDYQTLTEYFSILKTPIVVSGDNSLLTYKDIAIVETGEPGTSFGDFEFWDYVIVEGTKDGKHWEPLASGYDASFDPAWQAAYDNGEPGTDDMFVEHELDLNNAFRVGDTVLVRFRLFSDPGAVGWGWLIDDVRIGETVLSASDAEQSTLEIYPNPFSDAAKVNLKVDGSSVLRLLTLDGKLVRNIHLSQEVTNLTLERGELRTGIYLLQLTSHGKVTTKRVLIK